MRNNNFHNLLIRNIVSKEWKYISSFHRIVNLSYTKTMSIQHVSIDTDIDDILNIIHKDAAVVIDNVLTPSDLNEIKNELDPYLRNDIEGDNEFTGFKTKRVGALMARSPKCRELALDPKINALSKKFLEPHCDDYQLHFTSAISIGPNETSQILHRDRGVWGGYVPRKIETQFSTIWAITDFTKENGATLVVPGSHKWDKDRMPKEEEIESAEMQAGSVFIYTGSIMHGGGANNTLENRLGVFLHYAPNWLRQEENQYLSCPPSIAKNLEPRLRDLMGYSQGGYVLGFFTDPTDTEGKFESVSPKKLFGENHDKFQIESSKELVNSSTKKN